MFDSITKNLNELVDLCEPLEITEKYLPTRLMEHTKIKNLSSLVNITNQPICLIKSMEKPGRKNLGIKSKQEQ